MKVQAIKLYNRQKEIYDKAYSDRGGKSNITGYMAHYVYPNGDEVSNFEIVHLCRKWSGEIQARDGEIEDLQFVDVKDIDIEQISPPIRSVVQRYIREQVI